ncbi:MAG TPA: TGS domain-containing protein [Planctomycetota bacterium]|nr:TGS domain-containing protein [Planctomycetota bacterium]HRT94370.1 TGS domain-containing protein [Planctomycetota bacterium]
MPANLSPEYKRADEQYRQAKTHEEKLAALEEMLATIPKHKGTEHMQADLKRRIAKMKEAPATKAGARSRDIFHVERGGAGQVVLLGFPNCGKSALVGALTNARVSVTDYPFGTHAPVPGMAFHEDVPIQLVDMPPMTPEAVPPGMMGAYRSADIIAIVVDLAASDALEQLDGCLNVLTNRGIWPVGRRVGRDERDAEGRQLKTALVLGTKDDLPGAADTFAALRELYGERLPMLSVSATTRHNLDAFVSHLFTTLDVIRVYCKQPGKPPDLGAPFILPRGSSVVDMARAVHREFPEKLKYACVWGSAKFDGQQVPRDHVLRDRDIVELHVPS